MNFLERMKRRMARRQVILDKLKAAPPQWYDELSKEWANRKFKKDIYPDKRL